MYRESACSSRDSCCYSHLPLQKVPHPLSPSGCHMHTCRAQRSQSEQALLSRAAAYVAQAHLGKRKGALFLENFVKGRHVDRGAFLTGKCKHFFDCSTSPQMTPHKRWLRRPQCAGSVHLQAAGPVGHAVQSWCRAREASMLGPLGVLG
jgi:hypothetical protein